MINEHGDALSTSSLMADSVEQWICNAAHPHRPLTESILSNEFGAGRRVVRQTSRILQQRGVLAPRRGGNGLGGLWVIAPSLGETVATAADELGLGQAHDVLSEAARWLAPSLADRNDVLAEMVRSLLRFEGARQEMRMPDRRTGNLAEWLAGVLLGKISMSQGGDVFLGALSDIGSDYGVSLEVVVEAVRILADARIVEVRRGRAGGVFASTSGTGRALHVANAYLATHGVSTADCREVLDRINTGMIELARHRRTSEGLDRVRRSFQQMQQATNGTDLGTAWYGFIRDIADMAGNPVMHFMARALASSILMRRTRSAELPDAAARELLAASAQILDHLDDARQAPIVAAQSRCQKALENYW
ncbi:MAG: FCD domain-containing protein [Novosphingobium sp.]